MKRELAEKRIKTWRPPLMGSLFVSFLAFSLILVGLLWIFQTVLLDRFYRSIKTADIKRTAATIADNINHDALDTLISRIAQRGDVSIRIFTVSGDDLFSIEIGPSSLINHMATDNLFELYDKTIAAGGEYLERYDRSAFNDDRYDDRNFVGHVPPPGETLKESIIYSKLVELDDGTQAVILLNTILSPVTATVETLRVQLTWITLILAVLSLVLALALSKRIARPIIRINAKSKEMAAGRYDIQFEAADYREVQELAETLNQTVLELSRVEALRRELIANISHDLRTPLTMIRGYAEVIRDLPGEDTAENVQVIIDESNRLTNLVSQILDFSQLQADRQDLQPAEYNLTASIRAIVDRFDTLIETEGYQIQLTADSDVRVLADPARLEQVVYNLLTNAIQYTGDDHRVFVTQTVQGGRVRIAIRDTGVGIAPDQIQSIWDRYYQVDQVHRRAVVGHGLGLSIVKRILERHQASFGVESTLGQGSTFWFELPVC